MDNLGITDLGWVLVGVTVLLVHKYLAYRERAYQARYADWVDEWVTNFAGGDRRESDFAQRPVEVEWINVE
jgi:hypothetical protein